MGKGVVMDTKIVRTGRVATYFAERGYGFIYEDTKDKKLCSWFFHVKNCTFEPEVEVRVQFKIAAGPKGLMGIDVNLLDAQTGGAV